MTTTTLTTITITTNNNDHKQQQLAGCTKFKAHASRAKLSMQECSFYLGMFHNRIKFLGVVFYHLCVRYNVSFF